jgi:glycosyltransferase involved in cell wall biosynthesis
VGRLVPENGAHDLIAAGSHVKLPVPIAFVGDATYSERYKASLRAAAPLGTIFTGFQFGSAYQQLSAHAGIYVLAASVGGTHPVLLEQMAAGNCILARDTSSNREVLGDTGRFWRTPGELADVLRNVWANASLRRRLGDAARARAERAYDWETVTRHYLDLCAAALTGT